MGGLLIGWEKDNAEKLRALAHVLGQVIKAAKELGGSCTVSSDGDEGALLKVSRTEEEEALGLPEEMRSLFLPVNSEAVEVSVTQGEVAETTKTAGQEWTRKRKYGTQNGAEPTGSPRAKKIALHSIFRIPEAAAIPPQEHKAAAAAGTKAYEGTHKRKLDAVDAPEMTDTPPSRRRALNSTR